MADIKAEVRQEEIKGGNRVIVVEFSGDDWDGDTYKRMSVAPDATRDAIEDAIQNMIDNHLIGKEVESRMDELKEVSGDAVGLEVTPSIDPKKRLDDIIEKRREKKQQAANKGQQSGN